MTQVRRLWPAAVVVLAMLAVLAGQSATDRLTPSASGALTGRAMGRAGFAYLTGLRRFGAAVLWNRLQPQMHEFYGETGLGKMTFMLPNIKMITMLDPEFVEGYYVAPEILIQNDRLETGLDLAREGVQKNPRSGILMASYAEFLLTRANRPTEALVWAKKGIADGLIWRSNQEQWESLQVFKAVFKLNGETDLVDLMKRRTAALDELIEAEGGDPHAGHDHPPGEIPEDEIVPRALYGN